MYHIHTTSRMRPRGRGFTLIEMTIVIAIIAILAMMAMSVYATAAQQARGMRTRAIIAKIDQLISEKYESYRTRQVPIRIPPLTPPNQAAAFRLNAIRELMRMEMPDRITDVTAGPPYFGIVPSANYAAYPMAVLPTRPSLNKQYLRRAATNANGIDNWSTANENAECLYLILASMRDGDKSALDYFSPTEIGDTDNDGMNEILDAWGQPIAFLRWAPGYRNDVAPYPVTPQSAADPDPYDPMRTDPRWTNGSSLFQPFSLKPLVWSSGPDKRHGVNVNTPNDNSGVPIPYCSSTPPNDPYFTSDPTTYLPLVGAPFSADATDNITNHDLEAR